MWRVQGGLSVLAVSRERRVMPPSSLPIYRKPPPHPPFPHLTERFVLEFVVREAKRQASGRGDRGVKSASRLDVVWRRQVVLPAARAVFPGDPGGSAE